MAKTFTFLVIVFTFAIGACSSDATFSSEASPQPTQVVAYWSAEELSTNYPIEKIEVSGTFQAIGYALGQWYRNHGYLPHPLTTEEQETARGLIAFYRSVHPGIGEQIRGVYRAYNLSLDELEQGIPVWEEEGIRVLLPGLVDSHSCSLVFTRPEMAVDGHSRLGRNHDWPTMLPDTLLVFTYPQGGYPTVVMTRAAPGFSAVDGMNSRGLAFGLASVRNTGYQLPSGPAMPSNSAYRFVLEQSANVEEAIARLRSIPITFIGGTPEETISHFLLADRSGASAVVEFLPEGMVVSRTDDPYQVMTNSHWAGPSDQPDCIRYQKAVNGLQKAKGTIDSEGLMRMMSSIHGSTQWTIIYDLEDLSLDLVFPGIEDTTTYEFSLADFISRME